MKKYDFDLDNKVVQHNDLLKALSSMDAITLKLFEMAVSCIDTSKTDIKTIVLSKSDIFVMFEADDSNKYTRFKEHMKRLQRQIVTIVDQDNGKLQQHVAIPSIYWGIDDTNDIVKMQFNENLMPYLLELRANFTQYEIGNIRKMRSKYALIIYKLAKMNAYKSSSFVLTIEQLREYTDTKNDYSRFEAFERRVLKDAMREINGSGADLLISYEKVKPSTKITAVRFLIRLRNCHRDNDFDLPVILGDNLSKENQVDPGQMTIENL